MATESAGNWAAKLMVAQRPDAIDMSANALDSQSLDGAKGALAEGTLSGKAGTVTVYIRGCSPVARSSLQHFSSAGTAALS
jgi:hypothetical protein